MDLLRYLWTFDLYHPPNWGAKNLEFVLILAQDLASSDLTEGSYPIDELFEILLEPIPFASAMHQFPTIT